jgi:beta-1,4-mannosyltransferase
MKILIPHDDVINGYIPSLVKGYQNAQCEVVVGRVNFYLSDYKPDIVHIHWPEYLYDKECVPFDKPDNVIKSRIKWYKEQGARIFLTVHNLLPHDEIKRKTRHSICESVFDYTDIIIHHGQASIRLMKKEYPKIVNKKHIVCPHGHYLIHYRAVPKSKARNHLKLPQHAFVILNFGNIRPYKGFELLRNIFKKWTRPDKLLLVAGKFDYRESPLSRLRRKGMELTGRYVNNEQFHFKRIETQDIGHYFAAADLLLLSHTEGLTSGVLSMAATYGKPVVYPDIGNFREQMEGWIGESYQCGDVGSALNALDAIVRRIDEKPDMDNKIWLEKNSWDEHVNRILSAASGLQKLHTIKTINEV